MKHWQKGIITLACLALAATAACSSGQGAEAALHPVVRGDITVLVNGTGNLATRQETKLSFVTDGKIASIDCEEGQTVAAGAVLASLRADTLALAETRARADLAEAEAALAEAKAALSSANLAVETAGHELKLLRNSEDQLQVALLNAQINLEQAQRDLNTGINAVDYQAAEAGLRKAENWYEYVLKSARSSGGGGGDDWTIALERAEDSLDAARAEYDNVLSGYDSQEINIKKKRVISAEITAARARTNLDDLATEITLKEKAVDITGETAARAQLSADYAGQSLLLARQALENASRNLEDATLRAPFAGVVAAVYADTGDAVAALAPVVRLVNPEDLELIVEIDEVDIPSVAPGQKAAVSVDAIPGATFGGTVAAVYPVPSKSTGLVMYNVRVLIEGGNDAGLKVGMRAAADIIVGSKAGVIKVPSQAVREDGKGGYFVVVRDGRKDVERPVVPGISNGIETEIVSGLAEGENVAG